MTFITNHFFVENTDIAFDANLYEYSVLVVGQSNDLSNSFFKENICITVNAWNFFAFKLAHTTFL